mmetsp:Transcript_18215/g.34102  ORF Transcript_18215/g.34102 Transcript_18215/m.34102 type:complete len:100 (-) Transcript_18215:1461-1760(-)
MMKFQEKNNPRNSNWSMMKLYLRKHAKELSLDRWGSEEKLKQELERRNQDKLRKQSDSVGGLFSTRAVDDSNNKKNKAKRRKVNIAAIVANIKGASGHS